MIDFKITFQADELLCGDHKKCLISEIIFRKLQVTILRHDVNHAS